MSMCKFVFALERSLLHLFNNLFIHIILFYNQKYAFTSIRDCEIIIGNKTTLEQAKGTLSPLKGGALWKKIFSHLESRGQIFRGLPVTCQNHGTQAILTCPQDFVNHCRHGGCMEKCMKERECDHP